jgi:hypothetical protein
MIYNQWLYVIDAGPVRNGKRSFATLEAMQRAIASSPEPLPNIEFTMVVSDISGVEPSWAYARRMDDESIWLMLDFGLYSWPEPQVGAYSATQLKVLEQEEKVGKHIWHDPLIVREILPVREDLIKVTENKPVYCPSLYSYHS